MNSRGGAWEIPFRGGRRSLGRSGTLLVSRVIEQGVLGLANFALAWRLGLDGFAAVSALLIVNSFAIVGSDFGLGTEILRRPIGGLSPRARTRVRLVNSGIALITMVVAVAVVSGSWRLVVVGSGLLWLVSAEAFILKSAALRLGESGSAAFAEVAGSTVFAAGLAAAIVRPSSAVVAVAGALTVKHAVEALWVRRSSRVFSAAGVAGWSPSIWLAGVLTFAIGNVDFVLVGIFFSTAVFSLYTLAFRISSLLVAQVSYVVQRVALVDFGESPTPVELASAYGHRVRQLFGAGVATALLTALASPLLPWIIGSQWTPAVAVIMVLAVATPWRMVGGLGGYLAIAVDGSRQLARWEASRLVVLTLWLVGAALVGFPWFVSAVAIGTVATAVAYDGLASRLATVRPSTMLRYTALCGILLLLVGGFLIQVPN